MQHGPLSDLVVTPNGNPLELADTQPGIARWRLDGTGPITRRLAAPGNPTGYDDSGRLLLTSGPDYAIVGLDGSRGPVQRVVAATTGTLVYRNDADMHTPVWTGLAGQLAAWDRYDQGHLVDVRTGRTGLVLESGLGGAAGAWMSAGGVRLLGWSDSFGGGSVGDAGSAHRGRDPIRRLCRPQRVHLRSGRLVVWSDGSQLRTVRASDRHVMAHRGGIVAGAVSPDGVAAASGPDGSLIFLDLHTLRPRGRPLPDAPGTIEQFAFSRDGSLLAARSPDGTVRIIDMASHTQLGEPIPVTSTGNPTIALRPDGRALAQPSPKGLLIWDLHPTHWQTTACHLAGRDLTSGEWQTYLSAVGSYQRACPAAS